MNCARVSTGGGGRHAQWSKPDLTRSRLSTSKHRGSQRLAVTTPKPYPRTPQSKRCVEEAPGHPLLSASRGGKQAINPQSKAGSPCRYDVQCPRTTATISQKTQKDAPPRTWKSVEREITKKKNRTALTRTRAPGARCRLPSRSPPPSHVAQIGKRGKPETTVAWEARRRGSMRGDRRGWMNVVGPPVHIRHVRPPSWTRLPEPASCLPG